jgi:hypothetical protein
MLFFHSFLFLYFSVSLFIYSDTIYLFKMTVVAKASALAHEQWGNTKAQEPKPKLRTKDKGQPKVLYSTVDFSKVDPLYMRRSVSFYREAGGLFTFREYPRVKRIRMECARLSSGNLQLALHVIGAPWRHAANRGVFPASITCACRREGPRAFLEIPPFA